MAENPDKTDPKDRGDAVPTHIASSTHVATRRNAVNAVPQAAAPAEPIKPTIAEALRETADAVQEAVRELTGKIKVEQPSMPVAIVTPTAEQIKAADQIVQSAAAAAESGVGAAGAPTPSANAAPAAPAPSPAGSRPPGPGSPGVGAPPPPQPPAEMVTVKIDGKEVRVKKGTNILDACLAQGVDISYFCYHRGLSAPAVCRQCLVEVAGQPKLVPSCYTPVADKMEILASSDKARLARQQMLEFTLVNHPVDCPICDKAGECVLQKMYMEWDGARSRTDIPKVHKPKAVDLGPYIVLDAERCILCTRCIRVCDEVAGQHQLEMVQRGDHEVLAVAPGQRLDNPYSLNTVDVCPVGALTSKDFRFTLRAWELYAVESICPGCATGCNVEIHHGQGEIWRLVPRENPAVNQFWMCDEGRFTYKEVRQRRVAGARYGQGRGLPGQIAAIDKAVAYAAERLGRVRQAGGALGLVFSAQAQNEALYALRRVAEILEAKGTAVRRYVLGRAPRPERQDKILRSADVNPNTAGAQVLADEGAGDLARLRADLLGGQLHALWMVGEDVPLTEAEVPAFLPMLDRLDLFIVQAVHDTPVTQRAQVLLPAAAWAEVDGTFTTSHVPGPGITQRIRRAVAPPGDARPHQELVALLARKAGLAEGEGWQGSPRQAFVHMTGAVSSFAGAEWGRPLPPVQLRFAHSRG